MPTIQVEARVSSNELLQAANQFSADELQRFIDEILALRARRQTRCLPAAEADLFARINQGLPVDLRQRYHDLIARRRQLALTTEELTELQQLAARVEELEGKRLAALVELAQLRQASLAELMDTLGIRAPAHE